MSQSMPLFSTLRLSLKNVLSDFTLDHLYAGVRTTKEQNIQQKNVIQKQ